MPEIDQSRAFVPINIAILTVSDTRTVESDKSGDLLKARIEGYGHRVVARSIVKDEIEVIQTEVKQWIESPSIDVVISTGGTGLTSKPYIQLILENFIPGVLASARRTRECKYISSSSNTGYCSRLNSRSSNFFET